MKIIKVISLSYLNSFAVLLNDMQELESEKQFRQAEHHYLEGKDWKSAVNMYRANDLWDESYRVWQLPSLNRF